MFEIDTDKTISITRGDSGSFVAPIDYALQSGDVLRLKVFRKKACEDVVLQKDFAIGEATETVTLELTEKDTRIGKVISKPVDYWYEIELNPDNNPKTLVGYDEDGAKIFRLYPEGRDLEGDELTEEEKDTLRKLFGEFKNEIHGYVDKVLGGIENGSLKIEDVITDSNTDPSNKHQVYSAEVMLGVVAGLVEQHATKTELEDLKAEIQGDLDEIGDLVGQSLVEQLYNFYGVSRGDYPYVFLTYTNDLVMNLNFVSTFTEKGNGSLLVGEYPEPRLHGTAYSADVNLKNLDTTPEFMVKYCMEVISSVEEKKTSQNSGAGGNATLYTNAVLEETYEDGSVYYIE